MEKLLNQTQQQQFLRSFFGQFDEAFEPMEITTKLPYDYFIKGEKQEDGKEVDETHVLKISCAGFSKEEIKVSIRQNILSVKFKKEEPEAKVSEKEIIKYVKRSLVNSNFFEMQWALKNTEGKTTVKSAKLKNGILTIELKQIKPKENVINIDID